MYDKKLKMSVNQCCIAWCRSQTDGAGKSGGFFRLPSLTKRHDHRLRVVNGAGLGEAYMKTEGNFRICFRHYKASDMYTDGQKLTLDPGR